MTAIGSVVILVMKPYNPHRLKNGFKWVSMTNRTDASDEREIKEISTYRCCLQN